MSFPRSDLIVYRIQRAWDTLEEARLLASAARWNACINRLYYACFYAVSAILLQKGLSSSKHSGIRSLFGQNFLKPGIVDKETAKFYNNLFKYRQEGDYTDFVEFEQSFVKPLIPRAEKFIQKCNELITENTQSMKNVEDYTNQDNDNPQQEALGRTAHILNGSGNNHAH